MNHMAAPGTLPPTAPKGSVDFSVIGEAFDLYGKNWLAFSVFSLIMLVGYYAVSMIISLPRIMMNLANPVRPDPNDITGFMISQQIAGAPFTILTAIIGGAIFGLLFGGITLMTFKAMSGQRIDISDGFAVFSNIVPFGVAGSIITCLTTIGSYMCCIPGLIIGGLFLCTYPVIAYEKLGVMDAIKRSTNIGSKHILMLTLFVLVQGILIFVGALLCCIPVLATLPAAYICNVLIYRDLVGFGGPQSATVYPREGGGSMPGYETPRNDPAPPPPGDPEPPTDSQPPQGS